MHIKKLLVLVCILMQFVTRGQKIDSIYVDLYTDSLKKGTYNYINIDGKLSNGRYIPLDSTDLLFWCSDGKFYGNSLWIDRDFKKEKVFIKVVLRKNPKLSKEFTMCIKQRPDNEKLKSTDEILNEIEKPKKKNS